MFKLEINELKPWQFLWIIDFNFRPLKTSVIKTLMIKKYNPKKNRLNQKIWDTNDSLSNCGIFYKFI